MADTNPNEKAANQKKDPKRKTLFHVPGVGVEI